MYKYYLIERARSIGIQPDGYKDWKDYDRREYVEEIQHMAWGELYYDRRLTQKEVQSYSLIDANGPEILRDPTGDIQRDRERELDGADVVVQFQGDRYATIDLHSEKLDAHGELWAMGAYGNAKIYVMSGAAEEIYLLTEKGIGKAYREARLRIKEKKDAVRILKEEVSKTAIRIIDKEYLQAQHEALKAQSFGQQFGGAYE